LNVIDPRTGKPRLLVLVGPTAVGKTRYSIEIARRWNAEIISGDSMQVYRGMDIGTAKIRPEETEGIPHHLIDIRDPVEPFSAGEFQRLARGLIAEIAARGRLPFVVGGTGLYIESLLYGFDFPEAPSDGRVRAELKAYAEENGAEALHARLQEVDPETAARLHPNDVKRVIRALEIALETGESMSAKVAGFRKPRESPYAFCLIGLTMDREVLYDRINKRVDAMIGAGLVDEVRELLRRGVPPEAISMQAIGYKEIVPHLTEGLPLEEAVERLKRDTRRYAKRQLSWFRRMNGMEWVDVTDEGNFLAKLETIHAIITGKFKDQPEYNL
jgi:tRNA dimethylallyltransferase